MMSKTAIIRKAESLPQALNNLKIMVKLGHVYESKAERQRRVDADWKTFRRRRSPK